MQQIDAGRFLSAALLAAAVAPVSLAAMSVNESSAGDFSNNRLAPTNVGPLGLGLSTIAGKFGRPLNPPKGGPADEPDIDSVTFTIGAGQQLNQLIVQTADVGGAFAFIGLEAGPQISVPHDTVDASTLLGWHHCGSADLNQDILVPLSVGPGAIGFSGPLGPGTYTLWIMELDQNRQYEFSFGFNVVPVPSIAGVLAGAGVVVAGRRRRG
jgi:hypothetical protein